jgi:hypothetical protein
MDSTHIVAVGAHMNKTHPFERVSVTNRRLWRHWKIIQLRDARGGGSLFSRTHLFQEALKITNIF